MSASSRILLLAFDCDARKKVKECQRLLRIVENDTESDNFLIEASLLQPEIQPDIVLTRDRDHLLQEVHDQAIRVKTHKQRFGLFNDLSDHHEAKRRIIHPALRKTPKVDLRFIGIR